MFCNKVTKIEEWFLEVIWGKKYSASNVLIMHSYQGKCFYVAVWRISFKLTFIDVNIIFKKADIEMATL